MENLNLEEKEPAEELSPQAVIPENEGVTEEISEESPAEGMLQDEHNEQSERNEPAGIESAEPNDMSPEADYAQLPEVIAMVAEAEQRGYLRGRNDVINELASQPGIYQPLKRNEGVEESGRAEILILNNMRPSIWD